MALTAQSTARTTNPLSKLTSMSALCVLLSAGCTHLQESASPHKGGTDKSSVPTTKSPKSGKEVPVLGIHLRGAGAHWQNIAPYTHAEGALISNDAMTASISCLNRNFSAEQITNAATALSRYVVTANGIFEVTRDGIFSEQVETRVGGARALSYAFAYEIGRREIANGQTFDVATSMNQIGAVLTTLREKNPDLYPAFVTYFTRGPLEFFADIHYLGKVHGQSAEKLSQTLSTLNELSKGAFASQAQAAGGFPMPTEHIYAPSSQHHLLFFWSNIATICSRCDPTKLATIGAAHPINPGEAFTAYVYRLEKETR